MGKQGSSPSLGYAATNLSSAGICALTRRGDAYLDAKFDLSFLTTAKTSV